MNKKYSLIALLAALLLGYLPAVAEETEAPVPVRMVPPKYPHEMRKEGVGGVVTVTCIIDESGNVTEPVVQKASHDAFVKPALEALKKWKFKPAKRGGTPVPLKVSIPIQFSVNDD
jgi:periplasmic protein TonB